MKNLLFIILSIFTMTAFGQYRVPTIPATSSTPTTYMHLATIGGNYVVQSASGVDLTLTFAQIASKPTTLSGFGITDGWFNTGNTTLAGNASILGGGTRTLTLGTTGSKLAGVTFNLGSTGFNVVNTGPVNIGAGTNGLTFGTPASGGSWTIGDNIVGTPFIAVQSSDNLLFSVANSGTHRFGATASVPSILDLFEQTTNGINKLTLRAPTSIASNVSIEFPAVTGTTGQQLRYASSGVLEHYTPLTNPATAIGDILVWNGSAFVALADIATGNALITGGVATSPSYGKIGLTTHVSGRLPYANIIAPSTTSLLLGRGASGGDWQEITLGTNLSMSGTTLNAAGGGGGAVTDVSGTSPITASPTTGSVVVSIANSAADGSTKGAASFTAADFDASSGNISLDYTNAQAATGSLKGFLTAADWTTFNGKQATGLSRLLTGTNTFSGAVEDVGTSTNTYTYTANNLGAYSTPVGLLYRNTQPALTGAQQYSPATIKEARGFRTASGGASETVLFAEYDIPVQGVNSPAITRFWRTSIDGSAYFSAMNLNVNETNSTAILTVNGTGAFGPVTATTGTFSSAISSATTISATNKISTGGLAPGLATKSTAYTTTVNDYTLLGDATSASFTFTLPVASLATNTVQHFKKIDASLNTITVDAASTETIDGALTVVLSALNDEVTIQSNGTNWFIIAPPLIRTGAHLTKYNRELGYQTSASAAVNVVASTEIPDGASVTMAVTIAAKDGDTNTGWGGSYTATWTKDSGTLQLVGETGITGLSNDTGGVLTLASSDSSGNIALTYTMTGIGNQNVGWSASITIMKP